VSIELPEELVWAMNFIGLPWPTVNEDQLTACATHLRTYASSLSDTHGVARAQISALSGTYASPSYEVLAERWAHFSSTHVSQLVEACHLLADALDVAADVVVGVKGAIIAALVAMAAEFVAEQAAAVATFGLAEFASMAIVETTKLLVRDALNQLEQQLIAEVLQAALSPLESRLESAVQGMVLQGVEAALA
jgi:hypothetical protein